MSPTLLSRAAKKLDRALAQRDAYRDAAVAYQRLLRDIDMIPEDALDMASTAIRSLQSAINLEKTCPKCASHEDVEQWGESGEFWWHCHACDKDFD